jgi:hypothetical protein
MRLLKSKLGNSDPCCRFGVFSLSTVITREDEAMTRERYKKQQAGSFFGDWIYDRVVPQDHFLRRLQEIVPWGVLAEYSHPTGFWSDRT